LVYFSGKRRELQERTLQNSLLQPSLKVLETQEKWLFLFQMERSFSRPPRYDHFGNSPYMGSEKSSAMVSQEPLACQASCRHCSPLHCSAHQLGPRGTVTDPGI